MILKNVSIQNFKGIRHLELEFHPGFNLIKGINGTGKTSILEALAVGLGGFVSGVTGVSTRHFSQDEIRRQFAISGDGACDEKYQLPVRVNLSADLSDGRSVVWTRERADIQGSRSTVNPRTISKIAEEMTNSKQQMLPLLCYHGTGRVWSQKRAKSATSASSFRQRSVGYADALQGTSNNKFLLDWCVKMEQVGWQKESKITEYEAAKNAAAGFINIMEGKPETCVFYDKQMEELMFYGNGMVVPISCMSAGYQSLIWMVFDIASRMAILNPFLMDRITDTPGVVLIDELDMHLHPKWQWQVIDALRSTFPNLQFIATTHAPILFSSARDVWLIDIDNDTVEYETSHYGLDVNASVTHYQGAYDLPRQIKIDVDAFNDAMDEESYDTAKSILDRLSETTAPEFPLIVELQTRYGLETALREIK